MAAPPTVSHVFVPNTIAESEQVNQNFSDLISWITANTMQRDGSVSFTGIPLLPATMPSNANHAVRKGYVDAAIGDVAGVVFPVGSVIDYVGDSAPEGWALLNGQTLANAESLFPQLWATAPVGWRSGSNIVLPNLGGRVTAGRDSGDSAFQNIGQTGGSKDAVVVSHGHGASSFSGSTSSSGNLSMSGSGSVSGTTSFVGNHNHVYNRPQTAQYFYLTGATGGTGITRGFSTDVRDTINTGPSGGHDHSFSGSVSVSTSGANHSHSFSGAVSISSAGESGVNKNLQPYIVMNKIIKVG